MTKDVEHFFKCFSVICEFFFENIMFSSISYFLIRLFFDAWVFLVLYVIWILSL